MARRGQEQPPPRNAEGGLLCRVIAEDFQQEGHEGGRVADRVQDRQDQDPVLDRRRLRSFRRPTATCHAHRCEDAKAHGGDEDGDGGCRALQQKTNIVMRMSACCTTGSIHF